MKQLCKILTRLFSSNVFSTNATGNGLFTHRAGGAFSPSYTYSDAKRSQYCDYIEQRAHVLDPTSSHLLTFKNTRNPYGQTRSIFCMLQLSICARHSWYKDLKCIERYSSIKLDRLMGMTTTSFGAVNGKMRRLVFGYR